MSLRTILSNYGFALQRELSPTLEEELGPLGERYELFVTVLGFVPVEPFLTCWRGLPGRPQADRAALARAFSAKAVFAISTTRALVERLVIDRPRRRLCGWSQGAAVPSEATLSRAFSDFADSALPSRLHEALIDKTRQRSSGRPRLTRFDGDLGAREANPEAAPSGYAETPPQATAQG